MNLELEKVIFHKFKLPALGVLEFYYTETLNIYVEKGHEDAFF